MSDFTEWTVKMKALADVCGFDLDLLSPYQINKFQMDLADFIGFEKKGKFDFGLLPEFREWWNRNDWRGKRKQQPIPSTIRETWSVFLASRLEPKTVETCGACDNGVMDGRLCPCIIGFRDSPWDSAEHRVLTRAQSRLA